MVRWRYIVFEAALFKRRLGLIYKKFPKVSKASIHTFMSKYGIKRINESVWTQEELAILRNN